MSVTIDDEIRILNLKKYEKQRMDKQKARFAKLPSAILVTLIGGKKEYFSHSGRSRMAKRQPFAFYKGKPLLVKEPEDIIYFMRVAKLAKPMFSVKKIDLEKHEAEVELEEYEDELAEVELESSKIQEEMKAKVEAIEKEEAEKKAKKEAEEKEAKLKAEAKLAAKAKAKGIKDAKKAKAAKKAAEAGADD